jgi:GNAT superfamily N-acetyltransferase
MMKIVPLNAATLPIYYRELATLLLDSIAGGASVGYQHSLSREEAESTFYRLRGSIDNGELKMWIARDEHGLMGMVRLELCDEPDGLNRATIKSLLVHSRMRRKGIGRQLILNIADYFFWISKQARPQKHFTAHRVTAAWGSYPIMCAAKMAFIILLLSTTNVYSQ